MKRFNCIKVCDKKWIELNDLSGSQYSANKNTRLRTPMPRSDSCEYRDAYIIVKARITVKSTAANNQTATMLAFKNNTPVAQIILK